MNDSAKLWFFLLLVPFFLAVGHDLWANYYATPEQRTRLENYQIDPNAYQGSDLGYLFVTYLPEPFEQAREMVGEESWTKWIDPILRLYTFVVALVPAILFAVWLLISRIFDIWPFAGMGAAAATRGRSKTAPLEMSRRQRDAEAQFKYKRR